MNISDIYLFPVQGGGQTVTSGASSVQSTAVGNQIEYVQISSNQDVYIEFGVDPTATSSSMFIRGDGEQRIYKIRPGHKIAALQVTASGTIYIHEMTR